jgi:hypothetical protein
MYRRPRRKPYIGWIAAILAVAAVVFGIYGLVKLLSGTQNLDKGSVQLPTSDADGVYAWKDGILSVEGKQIVCCDMLGKLLWETPLPSTGMKAYREGNLTAVWGGKDVFILDENGIVKQHNETSGDVVLARPGISTYAIITKEENQHRLWVYSVKTKDPVDDELFPYESILGMGYFGEDLNQLWTLAIDSHGTQPLTKLTTYYPGKAITGGITLDNEIGYAAILHDKMTYIVGTHTLTFWEHTSDKKDSKLIYGWNLQDTLVEDNGQISFIFSPTGNGTDQISALWYINTGGDEYRIPLPAGCFKAMLKERGRLCVATHTGVWSMAKDGTGSRYYPIGNTVDSIPAVIPGKAFVIQENHRNFLINMP